MTPSERSGAQRTADRIRLLREELASPELRGVLALTPEQTARFDEWARAHLTALAGAFDVDTIDSQARISWGMRIASALGGLALLRGAGAFLPPVLGLFRYAVSDRHPDPDAPDRSRGVEYAALRKRTLYFAVLLSLVAMTAFIMNLTVIGDIFNIVSTERALLAWGAFALLLAYRYGLRLMLVFGLSLLISYAAAFLTARMGWDWLDFYTRPEQTLIAGLFVFAIPLKIVHRRHGNFPPVY